MFGRVLTKSLNITACSSNMIWLISVEIYEKMLENFNSATNNLKISTDRNTLHKSKIHFDFAQKTFR